MKKLSSLFLLILLLSSCNTDTGYPPSVNPFGDFKTISMTVQDENGKPFVLDSIKVFLPTIYYREPQEITLTRDFKSTDFKKYQASGQYPIINDHLLTMNILDQGLDRPFPNYLATLSVVGYKGGEIVVDKTVDVSRIDDHVFCKDEDLKVFCFDKEIACTGDLLTFMIKVQDKDKKPYAFDSMKVYYQSMNVYNEVTLIKDFNSESFRKCKETGRYPIANDEMKDLFREIPKSKTSVSPPRGVEVIGYKGKVEVLRTFVQILADECHIQDYYNFDKYPIIITEK